MTFLAEIRMTTMIIVRITSKASISVMQVVNLTGC